MPVIYFQSSNHKRLQNGVQVSHDFVPRHIKLDYSANGMQVYVSITPTLSAKLATFQHDLNSTLVYVGEDRDYRFEIETKPNNEIKRVSVIRVDRNIELIYF